MQARGHWRKTSVGAADVLPVGGASHPVVAPPARPEPRSRSGRVLRKLTDLTEHSDEDRCLTSLVQLRSTCYLTISTLNKSIPA